MLNQVKGRKPEKKVGRIFETILMNVYEKVKSFSYGNGFCTGYRQRLCV